MFKQAIHADFRSRLIYGLALASLCAIAPMAWLRFQQGHIQAAYVDVAILFGVGGLLVALRKTGEVSRVATAAAIFSNLAVVAITWLDPGRGIYWAFVCIVGNFVLLNHKRALGLSGLMLAAILWHRQLSENLLSMMNFLASAALVTAFAYTFAYREFRSREQLRAMALQDPLTQLGNRRAFDWQIDDLMHSAQANGRPLAMFMIDVDHFKQINDMHGHPEGDRVLHELARVLSRSGRGADEVFRLGGEEFLMLLPNMPQEQLARRAEKLLAQIRESLQVESRAVTASIGATVWRPGESLSTWMARADAALYTAKASGRDRVVMV